MILLPAFQPCSHRFRFLHRWKKCCSDGEEEGIELSVLGPFTSFWRSLRFLWNRIEPVYHGGILCAFTVLVKYHIWFSNSPFCTRICDDVVSLILRSFVFFLQQVGSHSFWKSINMHNHYSRLQCPLMKPRTNGYIVVIWQSHLNLCMFFWKLPKHAAKSPKELLNCFGSH